MIGWHISVYQQINGGAAPASFGASHGSKLAVWQTGLYGLDWIDQLVKMELAISLGGNGYPIEYTAMAKHLKAQLTEGPAGANERWTCATGDILMPGWEGKTVKDMEALDACRPDEWLLIQAWDES